MKTTTIFSGAPARWMRLALLNLVFVVLAGVFTRYKITYSLPQVDFKNLLHAHSHFAFAAWASTALFAMIIAFFLEKTQQESKSFSRLFILNQITSYGMLFSFLFQEYGPVSIIFSTLSIFVTYAYAWLIWKHTLKEEKTLSLKALRFSLFCLVISSIGPFSLAYMEAVHFLNLIYFTSSVYWYLHFQYNGWFSFAVFAVVLRLLEEKNNGQVSPRLKFFLNLMIWACIPGYFVSVLWIMPPLWMFIIAGISGLIQLVAVVVLMREFFAQKNEIIKSASLPGWKLLYISFFSLVIKLGLQFFCVFPALNKFVFGHRPVIIGYLHLVLVGFLSFFLIGISLGKGVLNFKRKFAKTGLVLFVLGFIVQEIALLMDGIDNVLMMRVPALPPILFIAAATMLSGIILFVLSQRQNQEIKREIKMPADLTAIKNTQE
ncbi:MAG: hypothetical protein M3R17_07395 [Bacteroidota bacterium]|nr:hypothetical protein [Bacteroidota bacterium]